MNGNSLYDLPQEILGMIWEYDDTYRRKFDQVIKGISYKQQYNMVMEDLVETIEYNDLMDMIENHLNHEW